MADTPPHLCLLGDANSPHTRRWALEMRARGWRVSLVTARPEPLDGVEQRILAPVQRQTDWLLRTSAAQRAVREMAGVAVEIVDDVAARVVAVDGEVRVVDDLEAPRLRVVAARRPAREVDDLEDSLPAHVALLR